MPRRPCSKKRWTALLVLAAFALQPMVGVHPVWAGEGGKKHEDDQRDGKGKGKGQDRKSDKDDRKAERGGSDRDDRHSGRNQRDRDEARRSEPARSVAPREARRIFEDRQRVVVQEYYVSEYRAGRCPPGLAKKNNGCMPPGQAKKWEVGRPLPRDVIFYDLPPALVVQIGAPPPGYRYVRVAADILMIAVGTGMVIEAITDLGRL